MMPSYATGMVGKLRPIVARPGHYDPREWALATAAAIVEPACIETEAEVLQFRGQMVEILTPAFANVQGCRVAGDLSNAAAHYAERIGALADLTRWKDNFTPSIRLAMEELIERNLLSAFKIVRH